jgi:hypothetical protein
MKNMFESPGSIAAASRSRWLSAPLLCLVWAAAGRAESIQPNVQIRLREATVEVVLGKPEADPLTYEKELPLDSLPFLERTSKYRAVGTAFVVAKDRFITAAHVIEAAIGSQFGPLAIRDANGRVYDIDKILRYSTDEDYAEFTVRDGPRIKPLEVRSHPELNEVVFAVGNALGEGIVIRDGLYTSDTPEEHEGRWKWLRFSAAASPGNSGGPLVDRQGRVIGVILRKSPNENLNVAVGIDQVLRGSDTTALIERRFTYRFPVMRATDSAHLEERFPLPKSIADFDAAALAATTAGLEKIQAAYLDNHAANRFPRGDGSLPLLNAIYVAAFPREIEERADDTWSVTDPKPQRFQVDRSGYVETASLNAFTFVRLRPPDDVAPSSIYGDSKAFMDLVLKGMNVSRPVGTDAVRVTSLGAAHDETTYADVYGRPWQVRLWRLPFNDTLMVALALPTPQGYIAMLRQCPTALGTVVVDELKSLTPFVYVSLEGTLKQWQAYLAQKSVLPEVVRGAGLYLADTPQRGNWVDILRRPRPPASLPEEFINRWHTLESGGHPFTASAFSINGGTRIEVVVNAKQVAAGASPIAYTLTLVNEGTQDARAMRAKLDALRAGMTISEP